MVPMEASRERFTINSGSEDSKQPKPYPIDFGEGCSGHAGEMKITEKDAAGKVVQRAGLNPSIVTMQRPGAYRTPFIYL